MAGRIERARAQSMGPLTLALCAAMILPSHAAAGGGTLKWRADDSQAAPILRSGRRALFNASASTAFVQPRAAGPFLGGATHGGPLIGSAARRSTPALPPRRVGPSEEALIDAPPSGFDGLGALGCIAVSIYHEARDQPAAGQYAVGSVILTRAATPGRWGDTACDVVQPVQFSYLTPDRRFAPIREQAAWARAVRIAAQVLRDGPAPALQGADHYHTTYVSPGWNRQMTSIGRIADHVFWRSPGGP